MIEIPPSSLWLGNMIDARDPVALFDSEIKAVVDLAYEEKPAQLPRQLIYCRYPLIDGGGNDESILVHAMQCVLSFLKSETKVLVACSAGMSRSPTIAAFALSAFLKVDPQEVVEKIGQSKGLEINGALWYDASQACSRLGH